jgi:hypothetical protein
MFDTFKTPFAALLLGMSAFAIQPAFAATVYQSATLGSDDTGGETIQDGRSVAAVFSLDQTTQITGIGGEFEGGPYGGGTVFAAIVSLADFATASPDDLASVALAHVTFTIPTTLSNTASPGYYTFGDVLAPLAATLAAGDYALVFGVGQFGSSSSDSATLGDANDVIGSPDLYRTFYDNSWSAAPSYANFRVFVQGSPAPEPATWAMMLGGFGLVGGAMRARRAAARLRLA